MEMTRYEHGVPSWVDLGSPDPEAARTFYAGLFGWDIEPGGPEVNGYSLARLNGKMVAGLGPQMGPGPSAWNCYVNVDDVTAIPDLVTGGGGRVVAGPMAVMDLGHMGFFADPAGAVFGVWQAGTHLGAELVNEAGTFGWSELVTTDVEGSKPFYKAVFGWDGDTTGEGAASYTEWKMDGRSIGGMMPRPESMPAAVPPFWGVYFLVDDTPATVARATELGGSVMMPPTEIQPGVFSVLVDPGGASFNVLAMRPG